MEGDESDQEEDDEDDKFQAGLRIGITKAEMEENTQRGVALLRPHVNILLASLDTLIRQRMRHRGKLVKPAPGLGKGGGKGKKGGGSRPAQGLAAALRPAPVVTANEISALAAVSEWCTDPAVAQQLVALLMTALADSVRDKLAAPEPMLLMATSLRRLVFIAIPAMKAAAAGKDAAPPVAEAAGEDKKAPAPDADAALLALLLLLLCYLIM